jgi:hypothetical protein
MGYGVRTHHPQPNFLEEGRRSTIKKSYARGLGRGMPESEVADWKDLRSELRSHLYQEHNRFSTATYGRFSVEDLERIHEAFHIEGYGSQHGHDNAEGYQLGDMIPKFTEKDVKRMIKEAIDG